MIAAIVDRIDNWYIKRLDLVHLYRWRAVGSCCWTSMILPVMARTGDLLMLALVPVVVMHLL
jgi:hypothetical protein